MDGQEVHVQAERIEALESERDLALAQVRALQGENRRLQAALHESRQQVGRLTIERDQAQAAARLERLGHDDLAEQLAAQRGASPPSRLATAICQRLAAEFEHFCPDLDRVLWQVKPGRIPALHIQIGARLLAAKELPDFPPARFRRDFVARAELLRRQNYAPLFVHVEEAGGGSGRAQFGYLTGCRPQGEGAPPDPADMHALAQRLVEVAGIIETAQNVRDEEDADVP